MTTARSALILAAALLPAHALAQSGRADPSPAGLGQAERKAVDLKQGMTPAEVQQLLGKPRRTALRAESSSAQAGQGTLQWTYAWGGGTSSSSERTLQVDFVSKTAGQWAVNGWDWPNY
jgi:hypothetical protein